MQSQDSIAEALGAVAAQTAGRARLRQAAVLELVAAGAGVRQAVRVQLARAGVTIEGFQTLAALRNIEPAAASTAQLAQKAATTSALLGHTLVRLELSQLITRERDSADRRLVRVRLTPHGRATLQQALTACREGVEQLSERLGTSDLQALIGFCRLLHDSSDRLSRPTLR